MGEPGDVGPPVFTRRMDVDDDQDDEEREDDRGVRRTDEVLQLLFDALRGTVQGRRLERLDRAEADLRRCLDENADGLLTDPELALLALERQLDPEGAVARVASADVVLLLLPIFLKDARWHGRDAEDRRLRIQMALTLARRAVRLPELAQYEWGCAMWDVEAAVEQSRRELRREREGHDAR